MALFALFAGPRLVGAESSLPFAVRQMAALTRDSHLPK